jgi:hypothetical protein
MAFVPILAHATSTSSGPSTTSVNVLLNYGNGTLVWYNQTSVPSSWNFFNVTELITKGNLGAVFFASFGSHFVYSINGVGCPASNIFCDQAWGFWTLDGICWDLPSVGVDMIPVSQATTVAWYLTPAATFGETPPTGSNCLNVNVVVKPGDNQPVVNLNSQGVITVAILSTLTFDATKVNPLTVRFGRTGTEVSPVHSSLQDVNGDGLLDMVLQFKVQSTGLQPGDTQVTLMGRTLDGTPFRGSSAIQVIGP